MSSSGEKIDFVVTWVDGNDLEWLRARAEAQGKMFQPEPEDESEQRYRDWGLLKFWFRAVEAYCPWVNRVYLVTAGSVPAWLNLDSEKLVVVDQNDLLPAEHLPTFNSQAVEANFDRIPGLSEKFVYFNDDFFVCRPLEPEFFFPGGLPYGVAVFDAMSMSDGHAHAMLNVASAMNAHFDKKTVMRKNLSGWFSPRYGGELYRNAALFPWKRILPLIDPHLPTPILKSSMVEAFAAESQAIAATSRSPFRAHENIAPMYLVSMWQILKGRFTPRGRSSLGKYFGLGIDNELEILAAVEDPGLSLLCLNDVAGPRPDSLARDLSLAFERKHPCASSFEKN